MPSRPQFSFQGDTRPRRFQRVAGAKEPFFRFQMVTIFLDLFHLRLEPSPMPCTLEVQGMPSFMPFVGIVRRMQAKKIRLVGPRGGKLFRPVSSPWKILELQRRHFEDPIFLDVVTIRSDKCRDLALSDFRPTWPYGGSGRRVPTRAVPQAPIWRNHGPNGLRATARTRATMWSGSQHALQFQQPNGHVLPLPCGACGGVLPGRQTC